MVFTSKPRIDVDATLAEANATLQQLKCSFGRLLDASGVTEASLARGITRLEQLGSAVRHHLRASRQHVDRLLPGPDPYVSRSVARPFGAAPRGVRV